MSSLAGHRQTAAAYAIAVAIVALAAWLEFQFRAAVAIDFLFLGTGITLAAAGLLYRAHAGTRRSEHACAEAERKAAQAERLAQLTAALSRARSVPAAIDASVQEPLHALGADAAMLLLVGDDGRSATVARSVGYEGGLQCAGGRVPLTAPGPVRDSVRRGAPVILESRDARLIEYDGAVDDLVLDVYAAVVALPLVLSGRVVAVIRLDFRNTRPIDTDDHAYLEALAAHAGHALERMWEQESDQRGRVEAEGLRARADQELARRQVIEHALRASETRYRALATRTTRLHGLTAALSEAVSTRAVIAAIVQHATVVVGATGGDVLILTEDGTQFETHSRSADMLPQPRRIPLEPGLCEAEVIATRQPLFIKSWDESQQAYWRSASAAADAAYVSSTALPLLVDAAPAGVLRFDFSVPVNFDEEYQALLVSVAQHCSQALDRARLYESAQRARAEAEAASRLKDDFLSIVSHELRTPLNAVLGWASMLQKPSLDTALAHRAVRSILDNATRQAQLIDDLLDTSRIAAGRATLDLQDVDLASLLGGVVESLLPVAASSNIDLSLAPVPAAWVVGDRRRLAQVFFNLLGNALKFTPAGGRVEVDTHVAGAMVEVRVTDSGVGIEADFLPHVFDRFRQADSTSTRTYGGLGLGLSIAKQLVDAHKGSIVVESAGRGQGATFAVQLPLAAGASSAASRLESAPRPVAADLPDLAGTRVLVVDDEPDARAIMTCALEERGARVTAASTAAEAFDLLVSCDFDVLLADIAMPGEDGCALIRRVRSCERERVAAIPAAAVTAHAREEERRDVLAAGFHVHLVKPLSPATLARAVRELVHRGSELAVST
jgi:signal transduction histidine kinase